SLTSAARGTLCGIVRATDFMTSVPSTYEILALKALNHDIDKTWTDWAIEMLRQGHDTESLTILAGESSPYNQFELQQLTNKVLTELKLDYSDKDLVIKSYVSYLLDRVLKNELDSLPVLEILKDICIELNMEKYLYQFYLLYFAKDDLLDSDVQWYIDGANKNNIDKIITDYFKKWLADNPPKIKTTTA
ncbi:MAG TPA: hypothetical protein PLC65_14025, partial [Bacteroidia bacterium]|nr:hypothetical protein [Bacteroidia bacterium]